MRRLGKLVVVLFVLACVGVFATALFGGLMADSAFTPEAKEAAH